VSTTLTAPVAGVVTAVDGSVGSTVSGTGSTVSRGAAASSSSGSAAAGLGGNGSSGSSGSSAFISLDSLSQLEVVSGFAEADATRLAAGDPATISFPALPDVEVAGRVVGVSSTSTVVSNVVTYDVTIALVNPPPEVKEGMTANIDVVVETRRNVLELPTAAITTNGTVSTVELLVKGEPVVTRVQTGIVGNSTTEIVSGLRRGDVVVVPTVSVSAASTTPTGGGGAFFGGGLGGGGAGGGFRVRAGG
jgi:multidrug efflux pump subunit AcrA (membrane-fusion protein)